MNKLPKSSKTYKRYEELCEKKKELRERFNDVFKVNHEWFNKHKKYRRVVASDRWEFVGLDEKKPCWYNMNARLMRDIGRESKVVNEEWLSCAISIGLFEEIDEKLLDELVKDDYNDRVSWDEGGKSLWGNKFSV